MRLFLVRHGESLGNLNEQAYRQFGDHNVPLTQWGHRQAVEAGRAIASYLKALPRADFGKLQIWYSPFLRTRQSKDALLTALPESFIGEIREDYLLREQDFGLFTEIYDHARNRAHNNRPRRGEGRVGLPSRLMSVQRKGSRRGCLSFSPRLWRLLDKIRKIR